MKNLFYGVIVRLICCLLPVFTPLALGSESGAAAIKLSAIVLGFGFVITVLSS